MSETVQRPPREARDTEAASAAQYLAKCELLESRYARTAVCGLFLALGLGLLLGPSALRAQLTLPGSLYQWDGGAGTQNWGDAANWFHANAANDNQVPPEGAAVFFGALSTFGADLDAREEISIPGGTSIGSLWFDGHAEGPGYTLSSTGALTLGAGVTEEGADIIGVVDWYRSRETRLFAPTISIHDSAASTVRISNQSLAGLLIAGNPTGINDPNSSAGIFDLGARNLQIRGGSMTHIASSITGTGRIDVETGRTQLILNADNSGWTGGSLNIADHAIAVIKHSGALGSSITVNKEVLSLPRRGNGTLMLRSTLDTAPNGLELSPEKIYVYSQGAQRSTNLDTGGPAGGILGTIYNDSGDNTITSDIGGGGGPIGGNYFYSRSGNLKLTGRIQLDGNFTKRGLGTITLTHDINKSWGYEPPDTGNTWSVGTYINEGELRIEETHWALFGGFGTSYLSWNGSLVTLDTMSPTLYFTGGVLGLGVETHFTRKVGDGIGAGFGGSYNSGSLVEAANVYWGGRGGFIARGGIRTVELTLDKGGFIQDPNDPTKQIRNLELGGTLNWHKGGFMGAWEGRAYNSAMRNANSKQGGPLVLGSDSYDDYLIWKNPIYFGNRNQFQSELNQLQDDAGLTYSLYSPNRVIEIQEGVAEMQGKLSGQGFDLVKWGKGLLRLTSTESDYERQFYDKDNVYHGGGTRIEDGALQGAANNLDFTNITLLGGVYMPNMANHTNGIFNVTLGEGAGQFRWRGPPGGTGLAGARGGFAAGEQNTRIRINNGATLTWGTGGTGYFLGNGQELLLGHEFSGATLTWGNALILGGNDVQTLRVIRGRKSSVDYDAVFTESITATGGSNAGLRILGDIYVHPVYGTNENMHNGRVALRNGNNTLNNLIVSGASATLDADGKILGPTHVLIDQGGLLTLDNSKNHVANRLAANATLELDAGSFRYLKRAGETGSATFGTLTLSGGANTISTDSVLNFSSGSGGLDRVHERTTLNLTGNDLPSGPILTFANSTANYHEWLTVGGTDWAVGNSNGQFSRMTGYTTAINPNNWAATSHVRLSGSATVSADRSIRSLVLAGDGSVTIDMGRALTVGSGGLLFASSNISGTPSVLGPGSLATSNGAAFYAHVFAPQAEVSARFTGGRDLVKTGPGTLSLTGGATHQFKDVYIHEGRLELNLGSGGVFNTTGKIYVGDRSGKDVLRLPQFDNQITGSRHIVLRGGDYGAGVLEFALKPAGVPGTTAFAGTTHRLNTLEVQGRGIIDFRGGEVGAANYLYIDELIIDVGSMLTVLNWFEGEDYLLVHRSKYDEYRDSTGQADGGILANSHQRVQFEGYGLLYLSHYNEDYYEVTPFPRMGPTYIPEPSTYGALLGTLGLALFTWRKHRRTGESLSQ